MIITMTRVKSANIPEQPMPFALYRENVRISQPFATENDVWAYAKENGLCTEVIENEDMPPRRVLNPNCEIHVWGEDGEHLNAGEPANRTDR
jgi:hypothetical protein